MKYLVNLTSPIITTLRDGNFRGEPRWERNVVDALLTAGREVHTTREVWSSELPKPSNFHDGVNQEWLDDSVFISYGVPKEIFTGYVPPDLKVPYRIIQYHDGPSYEYKDTFLKYDREKPGSIVATTSFKAWRYKTRLDDVFGSHLVEHVIGPTVPYVDLECNNFNKKNLLWSYRNFQSYAEKDATGMHVLMKQISSYMDKDPSLTLTIVAQSLLQDPLDWFFGFSFTDQLQKHASRIFIKSNIEWHEMIQLVKESKLIVSPAEPLGGPPFEAAMFGIPTILESETNPFIDNHRTPFFPEVLMARRGISQEFLSLLDRLYKDESLYRLHGDAYRNYVHNNATYTAYVNQLEQIMTKRGWQ